MPARGATCALASAKHCYAHLGSLRGAGASGSIEIAHRAASGLDTDARLPSAQGVRSFPSQSCSVESPRATGVNVLELDNGGTDSHRDWFEMGFHTHSCWYALQSAAQKKMRARNLEKVGSPRAIRPFPTRRSV